MENLETKMEETRADLAMQQHYYSFFSEMSWILNKRDFFFFFNSRERQYI